MKSAIMVPLCLGVVGALADGNGALRSSPRVRPVNDTLSHLDFLTAQDCPCDNCVKYAECRAHIGPMGWITCEDKIKSSNSKTAKTGCIIFRTGDPQYCHAMYCTGVSGNVYSFDQANWTPGQCSSGTIAADSSDIIGIWCP